MGSANSACDRWTDPPTERHNAGCYDSSAEISIRFGVFPICVLECPRYSSFPYAARESGSNSRMVVSCSRRLGL
jgi:hypothetical protein